MPRGVSCAAAIGARSCRARRPPLRRCSPRCSSLTLLGYVDAGGQLLTFGLNPKSTHRILWITFLSFGPVLIARDRRVSRSRSATRAIATFTPLWFVLALCGVFYFFVDLPDSPNSIGWHAAKVGLVGFTPLVGFALQEAWRRADGCGRRSFPRWRFSALPACRRSPSTSTTRRMSGTARRGRDSAGPSSSRPASARASSGSRPARSRARACRSSRSSAAATRGHTFRHSPSGGWPPGLPLSMIPLAKYEKANEEIRQAVSVDERRRGVRGAVRHCIDYLVIGPPERTKYPAARAAARRAQVPASFLPSATAR